MKKTIAQVALFVGLVSPTFGQFTDSFDATVSGRWGTPASTVIGPPTSGASSISLSQNNVNSRVDWQLSLSGATNSANLFMPLQSYRGSYDSDWTAELAVVNGFSAATGQSTQFGLLAFNTNGMSANPTADYVKLVLVQADASYGGLAQGNVIHYGSHTNGTPDPFSTSSGVGSSLTLKLVYAAAAHTIAVYNGGSLLKTFGIAGSGGDVNQNWGMGSIDTFTLGLYSQSSTNVSGAGFTVSAGTAYADSLTVTGLAAIPEPGTYAVLFGIAALGLAVWQRRRNR